MTNREGREENFFSTKTEKVTISVGVVVDVGSALNRKPLGRKKNIKRKEEEKKVLPLLG